MSSTSLFSDSFMDLDNPKVYHLVFDDHKSKPRRKSSGNKSPSDDEPEKPIPVKKQPVVSKKPVGARKKSSSAGKKSTVAEKKSPAKVKALPFGGETLPFAEQKSLPFGEKKLPFKRGNGGKEDKPYAKGKYTATSTEGDGEGQPSSALSFSSSPSPSPSPTGSSSYGYGSGSGYESEYATGSPTSGSVYGSSWASGVGERGSTHREALSSHDSNVFHDRAFAKKDKRQPRDHLRSNALDVVRKPPRILVPREAFTRKGDTRLLCDSGMYRKYVRSKGFGKVPSYLFRIKQEIEDDQSMLQCMFTMAPDHKGFGAYRHPLDDVRCMESFTSGSDEASPWMQPQEFYSELEETPPSTSNYGSSSDNNEAHSTQFQTTCNNKYPNVFNFRESMCIQRSACNKKRWQ